MVPSAPLGFEGCAHLLHTEEGKEESRNQSHAPEHEDTSGRGDRSAGCAWARRGWQDSKGAASQTAVGLVLMLRNLAFLSISPEISFEFLKFFFFFFAGRVVAVVSWRFMCQICNLGIYSDSQSEEFIVSQIIIGRLPCPRHSTRGWRDNGELNRHGPGHH